MNKKMIAMLMLLMLVCCLTGCRKQPVSDVNSSSWETESGFATYLLSVREKSDAIKRSLEQEDMTQAEMNQKSGELRALWDEALNQLLDEAQKILPETELELLATEQSAWQTHMMTAVEEAGKAYEGGSLYPLVVNSEAAKLTEDRFYQLYERLK